MWFSSSCHTCNKILVLNYSTTLVVCRFRYYKSWENTFCIRNHYAKNNHSHLTTSLVCEISKKSFTSSFNAFNFCCCSLYAGFLTQTGCVLKLLHPPFNDVTMLIPTSLNGGRRRTYVAIIFFSISIHCTFTYMEGAILINSVSSADFLTGWFVCCCHVEVNKFQNLYYALPFILY